MGWKNAFGLLTVRTPQRYTSNEVCGTLGTISWSHSEQQVAEHARNISVVVQRSGGGVGRVSVEYVLAHQTTDDADVTATAHYTSSQRLIFEEGVTALQFLVTIHDDLEVEEDERFLLWLRDPRVVESESCVAHSCPFHSPSSSALLLTLP